MCKCYGAYDGDNIIAFIAVMTFPHPKVKNIKRCSRLVVLPDYQGIGIGSAFLQTIAQHYSESGYKFTIITSAKNMILKLNKSRQWTLKRLSVSGASTGTLKNKHQSDRDKCKTASFLYVG